MISNIHLNKMQLITSIYFCSSKLALQSCIENPSLQGSTPYLEMGELSDGLVGEITHDSQTKGSEARCLRKLLNPRIRHVQRA